MARSSEKRSRSQDWDCPIMPYTAVGKRLDELEAGKNLEAVIMASKSELQRVSTILKGTAKPYRVLLIELCGDGDQRVPAGQLTPVPTGKGHHGSPFEAQVCRSQSRSD